MSKVETANTLTPAAASGPASPANAHRPEVERARDPQAPPAGLAPDAGRDAVGRAHDARLVGRPRDRHERPAGAAHAAPGPRRQTAYVPGTGVSVILGGKVKRSGPPGPSGSSAAAITRLTTRGATS